MRARHSLLGIAAALAIGLAILQPASGAAAEEKKLTKESDPTTVCCVRDFDGGVVITN